MAFTAAPDGTHRYRATCTWSGSTGAGYDAYDRAHRVEAPPAATLVQAGLGDGMLLEVEAVAIVPE